MWLFNLLFSPLSQLWYVESTDISKRFGESLGIRDNGSRLYMMHQSRWEEEKIGDKIMEMCMQQTTYASRSQCVLYHSSGNFIISRGMNNTDSVMQTYSFSPIAMYWMPAWVDVPVPHDLITVFASVAIRAFSKQNATKNNIVQKTKKKMKIIQFLVVP